MTGPGSADATASGVLEFARFAFPPNQLGLCGPGDSAELLELAARHAQGDPTSSEPATPSRSGDQGSPVGTRPTGVGSRSSDEVLRLRRLAAGFEGAWPYLRLIAAANHLRDPLDPRVVQAYWIGNRLLGAVPVAMLGDDLDERFRRRAARHWEPLAQALELGAQPHHNFHVLCVYPWVGLLRHGAWQQALSVVDRCRIRWGRVQALSGDVAIVRCRTLRWDGRSLDLGPPAVEHATWRHLSHQLIPQPEPGDQVALHWDWLVRRVSEPEVRQLRAQTARHVAIANRNLSASPFAAAPA